MGVDTTMSVIYKVQDNCIEGYEGNVLVSLLYIADPVARAKYILQLLIQESYHNDYDKRKWRVLYYGAGYYFKFNEKYHRYATLIVKPQHIELLYNDTGMSDAELKEKIVEGWFRQRTKQLEKLITKRKDART